MTPRYRPELRESLGRTVATMTRATNGSYVRLVDYEALQAERNALQQQVTELTAHVRVGKP